MIAKWFEMRKDHIKKTLTESYIKNIDYKIIKGVSSGLKGKPRDTILLTPKCFKLMAMQSRTKKAIEVREYYYELEQVIDQYKEYIIKVETTLSGALQAIAYDKFSMMKIIQTAPSKTRKVERQLIYFICKIDNLSEIGLETERIPNRQLQIEEVDWAKFVTPEEAYSLTVRSQLIILDRLLVLG